MFDTDGTPKRSLSRAWSVLAALSLSSGGGCALSYDFDTVAPSTDADDTSLTDVMDVEDTGMDGVDDTEVAVDTAVEDTDAPTCVDECDEGETGCAGPTLRVCGRADSGCLEWEPPLSCGAGTCVEGTCVCDEELEPVDLICGALPAGSACRCDTSCEGTEETPGACVAGICMRLAPEGCEATTCDDGFNCQALQLAPGAEAVPVCVPSCDGTCEGVCDGTSCLPSEETTRCDDTCSDHCLACGPDASAAGLSCVCDAGFVDDGAGGCACVDTCDAGERRCVDDGTPEVCEVPDGVSCTRWVPAASCDGGSTCVDGSCTCDLECLAGTRRCVDELSFEVCEEVPGNLCATWSATAACSSGLSDQICVGEGDCACRPDVGRLCQEAEAEVWSLNGCNGLERLVERCDWGCDPDLDVCFEGLTFADVEAGPYALGASRAELGASDNDFAYSAMITRPYQVSTTEVTQIVWREVMGTTPSAHTECGMRCPVEQVSWDQALEFANALSTREGLETCYTLLHPREGLPFWEFAGLDCHGYRLPTEAEWEIAARARTLTATYAGDLTTLDGRDPVLDPIARYAVPDDGPAAAGSLEPNAWGLHDTSGNVWEWVWDGYQADLNTEDLVTDPLGPADATERVRRGGGYSEGPADQRSASRQAVAEGFVSADTGFRVARTLFDDDGDAVYDHLDNCPGVPNDQTDTDGDALGDTCDPCPLDALNDADHDGVCGDVDVCEGHDDGIDTDADGVADGCDVCPLAPLDDQDGDGLCDDVDVCPLNPLNPDDDGDGVCTDDDRCEGHDDRLDADADGQPDACDPCPEDPLDDQDADGVCDGEDVCPTDPLDRDSDLDGVCDVVDLCEGFPDVEDSDGDTIPDACDICMGDDTVDRDADGVPDDCDGCPLDPMLTLDSDEDGVCGGDDNCPGVANPLQEDTNGDGQGDACANDDDGDHILDGGDNCPIVDNFSQADSDGDGIGDACDGDNDGDGIPDAEDLCPDHPGPNTDQDGDGLGDLCDLNADGDAYPNAADVCPFDPNDDADGDGLCADVDPCPDDPANDEDGDGLCPAEEAALGTRVDLEDTDEDGLSDGDEVASGTNPLIFDTDGGGTGDGAETEMGTDPLNPDDDLPADPEM